MLALCYCNKPHGCLHFSPSPPRGLILRTFALQFLKTACGLEVPFADLWLTVNKFPSRLLPFISEIILWVGQDQWCSLQICPDSGWFSLTLHGGNWTLLLSSCRWLLHPLLWRNSPPARTVFIKKHGAYWRRPLLSSCLPQIEMYLVGDLRS